MTRGSKNKAIVGVNYEDAVSLKEETGVDGALFETLFY